MPTIHTYTDDPGYYIRARPPDIGNINYKIEEEAYPIIWQFGLRDADEIAWSTIQSLKELGFIYTEQSGTIGPDDFTPDPDKLENTKLSHERAKELFSLITDRMELSEDDRRSLRATLGLSEGKLSVEAVTEQLETTLQEHAADDRFPVLLDNTRLRSSSVSIEVGSTEIEHEEHDRTNVGVWIIGEGGAIHHCVHLCEKHGIERWHVRVSQEPSWEAKSVAVQQKAIFLPELLGMLPTARYTSGDPTDTVAPDITDMRD